MAGALFGLGGWAGSGGGSLIPLLPAFASVSIPGAWLMAVDVGFL